MGKGIYLGEQIACNIGRYFLWQEVNCFILSLRPCRKVISFPFYLSIYVQLFLEDMQVGGQVFRAQCL